MPVSLVIVFTVLPVSRVVFKPILTGDLIIKGSVCFPPFLTISLMDGITSSMLLISNSLIVWLFATFTSACCFNFNSSASACFAICSLNVLNSSWVVDFSILSKSSFAFASIFSLASVVASPFALSAIVWNFTINSAFVFSKSSISITLDLVFLIN